MTDKPLRLRHLIGERTVVCMPQNREVELSPEEALNLAADLLTYVDESMSAAIRQRMVLLRQIGELGAESEFTGSHYEGDFE